jgi:CheY-like chemotaxis protein
MLREILIADDNRADIMFLKLALNELCPHARVRCFNDGMHMMEHLWNDNVDVPDYIFLDIRMPQMDGLETLISLKQMKRFAGVPVIIYTGSDEDDIATYCASLGATSIEHKTDNLTVLTDNLRKKLLETDVLSYE